MSDEVSKALERLSREPPPGSLVRVESAVMERISVVPRAVRDLPPAVRVLLVAIALLMGIAGGLLPEEPNSRAQSLYPLEPAAKLAPSTLLGR